MESSCAQTLLGTRRSKTPPESETGDARSAMRAPTAPRQSVGATAGRTLAKRLSPARSRIPSRRSGAASGGRRRRPVDFMGDQRKNVAQQASFSQTSTLATRTRSSSSFDARPSATIRARFSAVGLRSSNGGTSFRNTCS
jgi:hypothetical protein